jgi:hypothetical protein
MKLLVNFSNDKKTSCLLPFKLIKYINYLAQIMPHGVSSLKFSSFQWNNGELLMEANLSSFDPIKLTYWISKYSQAHINIFFIVEEKILWLKSFKTSKKL